MLFGVVEPIALLLLVSQAAAAVVSAQEEEVVELGRSVHVDLCVLHVVCAAMI